MKFFASELGHNYDSYTFGYAHYCMREKGDELASIYQSGCLPYTGSRDAENIFYMARSARIDVPRFDLTSENRRIARKFDTVLSRQEMTEASNAEVKALFLDYFKKRHGEAVMPEERFDFIVQSPLPVHVAAYFENDRLIAAVLEVMDDAIGHFWFSAYDMAYDKMSLGMWLMLDRIREAKGRNLAQYYLGTVYGGKALYKTNFEPLEWWDGEKWSTDVGELKQRGRTDDERLITHTDEWKRPLTRFA